MPRILNRNSKLTFPRRNSLASSSVGSSSSSKSSRTESTCGTPDEVVPPKAMRRYSAPSSHDLARSMKAAGMKSSTATSRIPRVPSDAWGHFVDVSKPLLRAGTHNKRRAIQESTLHGDIDAPIEKNDSWLSFFG